MPRYLRYAAIVVAVVLTVASAAGAQGNSQTTQGSTPQGRPFQQMQEQISDVQAQMDDMYAYMAEVGARIAALDARITAIAADLQTQIDAIYSRVAGLETQVASLDGLVGQLVNRVESLEDATALLTERVAANTDAIAALQQADEALMQELTEVENQIASATDYLLVELQRIQSALQTQINTSRANMASLQHQTAQMQQFLNNLANTQCSAGQAVRDISPSGVLVCATAGGGGGSLTSFTATGYFTVSPAYYGYATYSCPTGYTLTSGGYELWPLTDEHVVADTDTYNTPYLTYSFATGYRLNHSFTFVRNEHRIPFRSAQITRDYSSWNTYRLAARAQAGRYNWTNYVLWSVNCARIQ